MGKLARVSELFDACRYDLLALIETWAQTPPNTALHICSVPCPPRNSGSGRFTAGMSLLGTLEWKAKFRRQVIVSAYCTLVEFTGMTLAICYFPPSLAIDTVIATLRLVPPCTVVLGDFNTKWTQPGSRRTRALLDLATRCDLMLMSPPTLNNDYVLGNKALIRGNSTVIDIPALLSVHRIKTDHALIATTIHQVNSPLPLQPSSGPRRRAFYFSQLPAKIDLIAAHYLATRTDIMRVWDLFMARDWTDTTLEERRFTVDLLMDSFSAYLMTMAEIHLSSYVVAKQRTKPVIAPLSTIRAFKFSKRPLQRPFSTDKDIPVLKHAEQLYTALWTSLPHLRATTPPLLPPCTSVESATITPFDVLYIIQTYPSRKSPGADGVAHAFYQHLAKHEASGPTFVADLARLFSFFRLVNVTPQAWNFAITTLLPKEFSAATCPIASSRPIALTAMLRRYFEGTLLITMSHQPWARLQSAQAGFRKRSNWSPTRHALPGCSVLCFSLQVKHSGSFGSQVSLR